MKDLLVLVHEYQESMRGRGLSEKNIQVEKSVVLIFGQFWGDRDLRDLKPEDFYQYADWLRMRTTKRKTLMNARGVQRYAQSLKSFGHWLYRRGYILTDPMQRVKLEKALSVPRKIPSQEEMELVLEGIEEPRERAMFELLYSCGLRVSEVVNLELSDVNLEERILLVRQGKGKKDRYVPFCLMAQMHLIRYLQGERGKCTAKVGEEHRRVVFLHSRGRMRGYMVGERWRKSLEKVGLEDRGYTVHSIRHAVGTHLLERGADVRYVQELLGHECLNTTQKYTRPNVDKVKGMYRSYHPRENQYYQEVTAEYREEVTKLKRLLLEDRQMRKKYALRLETERATS